MQVLQKEASASQQCVRAGILQAMHGNVCPEAQFVIGINTGLAD